jgi:hypothetical protein
MPAIGGARGLVGLVLVAGMVGLAFGSLVSSVLGRWVSGADSLSSSLLISAACTLVILTWLYGAIAR